MGNNGKKYSVVFGQHEGQWSAWVLAQAVSTNRIWRWDLANTGLENRQSRDVGNGTGLALTLMADPEDFTINDLFGVFQENAGNSLSKRIAPALNSHSELGGLNMTSVGFPEAQWVFKVNDGFVFNGINEGDWGSNGQVVGNYGDFSEWRRTGIGAGTPWGTEQKLDASGAGNWRDQNYASDTSHTGQTDFIQLADGRVFNAYIDNTDQASGNFGGIVLKERGTNLNSGWTTKSLNVVPNDGNAWHLELASDGEDMWTIYVPEVGGARDDAIFARRYDPDSETFGDEMKLVDIADGRQFDRMSTQWRFTDDRMVLMWSEVQGGTTYTNAAAFQVAHVPEPSTLDLLLFTGSALALFGHRRCVNSNFSERAFQWR